MYESSDSMIDENQDSKPFCEKYPGAITIDELLEPKKSSIKALLIDPKPECFH
jgi:hypothetical protein